MPKRIKGWVVMGHRFGTLSCFFLVSKNNSEARTHGGKELSGLGEYGSIDCRNCIKKFILRRRNKSFSKTGGNK